MRATMPRPLDLTLPRCPDHAARKVTRSGTYGQHGVVLYRCHARNGSTHSFAPTPGHLVRRFHYPAAEIAHALVLLGRASGFHQTALEARERTNRKPSEDSHLTVYWLERFAPAILGELLPRPRKVNVLLLDAQPFNVSALDDQDFPIPGGTMVFTVMAAAAQTRRGAALQTLRLIGSWSKDASAWRRFLKQVPGTPELVVCDGERAIGGSAQVRWPKAKVALSEWQTLHRAEEILVTHRLHSRTGQLYPALRRAFDNAAAWRRFVRLARATKLAALERWIIDVETIGPPPRFVRRDHPRTTGALEATLAGLKKGLGLSSASYKDLPRLNLVLGLMTLRANRLDSESEYARIIRSAAGAVRR
jgi:hypothetical protein